MLNSRNRVPRRCFFCGSFMLFLSYFVMLSCTSVCWCLVVTCWERADLLALVCDVSLWRCHFPIGILGQVWCLIVSIPDLCPFLKSKKGGKDQETIQSSTTPDPGYPYFFINFLNVKSLFEYNSRAWLIAKYYYSSFTNSLIAKNHFVYSWLQSIYNTLQPMFWQVMKYAINAEE